MIIPIPFIITGLLGLWLIIYAAVFADRRKLHILLLIPVGFGLIAVSSKAWSKLKHIEQSSASTRP